MPKPTKGPRLGGSPAHERLIIANLCKELIYNGSIKTTEAKAKRVRPHIEKLITKAKKGDTHNRRLALKVLRDREAAYILFEELAPKFANRDGGYTRTIKLPNRKGDNAPLAEISLVLDEIADKKEAKKAAPAEPEVVEAPEAVEATEEAAEVVEEVEAAAEEVEAEKAEAEDADAEK